MGKKIFLLISILLSVSSAAFAETSAKEKSMAVETEVCSVALPEKWSAINSYQMVPGQLILCLMAPLEEGESFQSNLNVTMQEVDGKLSEADYLKKGEKDLNALFPNFKILERGTNYHIYAATINGIDVKQVQFAVLKENKLYILTGTGTVKTFGSHYVDFQKIFKTFKPASSLKDGQIRLTLKDFSLTLPSEWYCQFTNGNPILTFYTPVNPQSGLRANLSLIRDILQEKTSVKEYLELSENIYEGLVENFELVERGKDFHVYTATNGDGLKIKETQFVKAKDKNTFFVLTATAREKDYDYYTDFFSIASCALKLK